MLQLWLEQVKGRVETFERLLRLFGLMRIVARREQLRSLRFPSEEGITCSCDRTDRGCAYAGCYARVWEQGLFDPMRRKRIQQESADYALRMRKIRSQQKEV